VNVFKAVKLRLYLLSSRPKPSALKQRSRHPVVAMVTDAILPYHRGGKELRYYELSRRLADRAEVHVYTMQWWDGPRVRREGGVTFHAISPYVPLYVNEQRRSVRQACVFALSCMRLLLYDFDVLEADNIPFLQVFVLRLVTLLKRRRLVVTWHEVWGKSYWRQYLGWAGYAAWLIEEMAMRLPDHILAASPQTADRLRASLRRRCEISLAIHGIDLDEVMGVHPVAVSSDLAVVGRLIGHKRVDMLLEAVALLRADGMTVTCRVIGDGPERIALHQKAEALGIADAVDFRHNVSEQKDVYALLKASRVCVFPSAREGFGVAVVEALACGVPVITTSAPNNLAQHTVARSERGIVCAPSATAIAEAVKSILSSTDPTDRPGNPEAWLQEYTWNAIAEKVAEALWI
jgi:glycosyltransferase involved in cell wall biosynthesis